jgi:hypothetical protein
VALDIGLVFHDDWQFFALAGVGTSTGGTGQGLPWGAVAGLGLETFSDTWGNSFIVTMAAGSGGGLIANEEQAEENAGNERHQEGPYPAREIYFP